MSPKTKSSAPSLAVAEPRKNETAHRNNTKRRTFQAEVAESSEPIDIYSGLCRIGAIQAVAGGWRALAADGRTLGTYKSATEAHKAVLAAKTKARNSR